MSEAYERTLWAAAEAKRIDPEGYARDQALLRGEDEPADTPFVPPTPWIAPITDGTPAARLVDTIAAMLAEAGISSILCVPIAIRIVRAAQRELGSGDADA